MKYRIYHISTNSLIEEKQTDFGPTVRRVLNDNGFTLCVNDEPADLIIYHAKIKDFYRLKYFHQLFECSRWTSEMLSSENTLPLAKEYLPVVTLYPGNQFDTEDGQGFRTKYGIRYWDSSVWQRWIDIDRTQTVEIELSRVLYQLKFYFNNQLYQKEVSIEYCDFSSRIYKNSYLLDIVANGHANYVTPFPFFSESSFHLNTNNLAELNGFVWRILLVDDDTKYKFDYFKSLLEHYRFQGDSGTFHVVDLNATGQQLLNSQVSGDKPILMIKQVFSIEEAILELSDEQVRYDIICLDYLLGADSVDAKKRQTGKQLLDVIKKRSYPLRPSVSDKFWIFLTTSYSTAFIDDLQHDVTSLMSDDWNIERGASFLQTPNYFLSAFINFLSYQLKETRIASLKECWIDRLRKLAPENVRFSRSWANETLTRVLNNWAQVESLKALLTVDPDNANPVIACFADRYFNSPDFKDILKDYENGLYAYLAQLLPLLSFGDGYEWEKMKTYLEIIRNLTFAPEQRAAELPTEIKTDIKAGFKTINDHIALLKEKYDP